MSDAKSISKAVIAFIEKVKAPVLFAGAGVSVRAGMVSWDKYLRFLAEQVRPGDQLTRHLMLECLGRKQYDLAAEYFYLTQGLTDGERFEVLASPFLTYDTSKLNALAGLPFSSYVTTNYDRALLDLFAKETGTAAIEVNLGDPTLTAAPFCEDFQIARIHGRVEVPESIVLSGTHYKKVLQDSSYIDFLRHIFCTRSLLFIGFSFLDPAIRVVLRAIRERVGAIHAGRHLALVSNDANSEFLNELQHHNIEVAGYSESDGHAALWDGLELAAAHLKQGELEDSSSSNDVFAYAHRFLASALARRRLGARLKPLTQAVSEGIVLEILGSAGARGVSRGEVADQLSQQLRLTDASANKVLANALDGLASDNLVSTGDDGQLRARIDEVAAPNFESAIAPLVNAGIERYIVREGGRESEQVRRIFFDIFEYLVLRRGWDLGAAYAARTPPKSIVVKELVAGLTSGDANDSGSDIEIIRSVESVLRNPTDEEATTLAELGRLAFALELVRQAPQDTLFSSQVMPTRIYLDANVLLPAIVEGHPYHSLYSAAMDKLVIASSASSSKLEVCAYYGFLNEVVSHRRIAQQQIEEYGPEAARIIEREARLFGLVNVNVFVAGFARSLIRGDKLRFNQFLSRYAPYRTEKELADWLGKRGVVVVSDKQMQSRAVGYPDVLHHFEKEFSQEVSSKQKTAILISHDALQVAALMGDVGRGQRAVFVTADRRMTEAVLRSRFSNIASGILSSAGFVQMIELFVGALAEERSIAQLIWSTRASSIAEKVRRYFTDLALVEYDAALAMSMESIVRELTEDVGFAIEQEEGVLVAEGAEVQFTISKYVEAMEPRFYELMRKEMERINARRER